MSKRPTPALRIACSLPPDGAYLIGISGGRDSVALLHGLLDAGYQDLRVCHLNHQLRGRESAGDARFVEKLAGSLNLNCEIGETDVRKLAKEARRSIETAARVARY